MSSSAELNTIAAYRAARKQSEDRIADLKRALAHQRELTEQERRRADRAEASAQWAWKIAAIGPRLTVTAERPKIRGS